MSTTDGPTLHEALAALGLTSKPAHHGLYRRDIVALDGHMVAEALDSAEAWELVHRCDAPAEYRRDDQRYRVNGLGADGLVYADRWCDRTGRWRLVRYGLRLAILTIAHTGSLPPNYPDSEAGPALLARLRHEAAAYQRA